MKEGSIRLSPRHGVNPCMGLCFWCQEPDGTVLLLGRLPNDARAPRHMVVSYEPCADCRRKRADGITVTEVISQPLYPNQQPISKNQDGAEVWPTGRWCVIREDAVQRVFAPDQCDVVLQARGVFLEQDAYQRMVSEWEAATS